MSPVTKALLASLLIITLVGCEGLPTLSNEPATDIVQTPDRVIVTDASVQEAKKGLTGSEFNPVEYLLFSQIEATARVAKAYCDRPDELKARLHKVEDITEVLVTHSIYLPDNAETAEIARILRKNIQEFLARYGADEAREAVPSQRYCERKLDLYIIGIRRALEAVGQKVRR